MELSKLLKATKRDNIDLIDICETLMFYMKGSEDKKGKGITT
jgi:hypothetical protein